MGDEIELKILLDEAGLRSVRSRLPGFALRGSRTRTQQLRAVYYDTVDSDLAARGMALRVRREGRRWVQTLKAGRGVIGGLSRVREWEAEAPGGRLDLALVPEEAARAAVEAVIGDRPLGPVFETVFRRASRLLRAPEDGFGGGVAEIALDIGEIRAAGRAAALIEAELELKEGAPRALFDLGKALFSDGPLRFSRRSKAARGYALAQGAAAVAAPPAIIRAAAVSLDPARTVEAAARDVLRGCLDQIGGNVAAAAVCDAPEAAHQLRVGLRRLRTAAALFGGALGGPALAALDAEARALAATAGAARDLDVLSEELLAPFMGCDAGFDALRAAVDARRRDRRGALKARLAAPETAAFLFDLGAFVESRLWLRPADFSQTEALAAPVRALASEALERRWRKAGKLGRKVDALDEEARHDLRKRLKKLRYAIEFFGDLYARKRVRRFLKRLKALQDDFGALQDLAAARALLLGPDAPGAGAAEAQRAVGYALGRWEGASDAAFARAAADWAALAAEPPFWRDAGG